jgi:L-ascorbate metabolism protein UlaG (beta-lactamase superfamily)
MLSIRRLSHSSLVITTNSAVTLVDPGQHTFEERPVDLDTIGDITAVVITHAHQDHVDPRFVQWLKDRYREATVHGNQQVADLLGPLGIDVVQTDPVDVTSEDLEHEITPLGPGPANRCYTFGDAITHPGDTYKLTKSAPVLTMALMAPWGSTAQSVECIKAVRPNYVIPVHDSYLSENGRRSIGGIASRAVKDHGIELVELGWGETFQI